MLPNGRAQKFFARFISGDKTCKNIGCRNVTPVVVMGLCLSFGHAVSDKSVNPVKDDGGISAVNGSSNFIWYGIWDLNTATPHFAMCNRVQMWPSESMVRR